MVIHTPLRIGFHPKIFYSHHCFFKSLLGFLDGLPTMVTYPPFIHPISPLPSTPSPPRRQASPHGRVIVVSALVPEKKARCFSVQQKNTGRNVARKKNKASAVLKHTCLKNDLTYSCRVENGWLGWVGQFWLSSCHLFFGSSMNYYDESIL